ncbi:unnamed protein product [Fraxinus pennsylvanica]|uniref:AP2/ERF domain-containing protein n=1 Tax=Fraxinus pennsylvanica TaxID=56036 RepID=A0AAD1YUE0_9LAMI|nr:unnamed protein product [Fraxinus pennsylvanica]
MKRKVRVSYSDPDATDSSSDEGGDGPEKKSKRMVREIVLQPEKNLDKKKGSGKIRARVKKFNSRVPDQNGKEKLIGVRKRKSGKYCAEIRDPFKKKRVWLGTYNTAEEASKVYLAKKRELEEKQSAGQGIDSGPCENSSEDSSPTVDEFDTLDSPNELASLARELKQFRKQLKFFIFGRKQIIGGMLKALEGQMRNPFQIFGHTWSSLSVAAPGKEVLNRDQSAFCYTVFWHFYASLSHTLMYTYNCVEALRLRLRSFHWF